jgi:hypothetical protein|tara:strand:- start:632 stop:1087 length:456 start_codon:yes stop_codon:yes gene_type:complete
MNNYDQENTEAPKMGNLEPKTTMERLMNPQDVSGEGYNAVKQISEGLTLNDSIENAMHSGQLTENRQLGFKLLMLKEFERKKLRNENLDEKHFPSFGGVETMGAKMALLELKTSNSLGGTYSENLITGVTGQVVRSMKRWLGKSNEEGNNK